MSSLVLTVTAGGAIIQVNSILAQFRASDSLIGQLDNALQMEIAAALIERLSAVQARDPDLAHQQSRFDGDALSRLSLLGGLRKPEADRLTRLLPVGGVPSLASFAAQVRQQASLAEKACVDAAAFHAKQSKRAYMVLLIISSLTLALFVVAGVLLAAHTFGILDVERRLQLARQSIVRAERDRAGVLAVAGHDLRQPLQAIGLFTSTIAHRPLDAETLGLLRKVEAATNSMQRMIDGLLDMAKLDAGLVAADFVSIPLSTILGRLEDEFTQLAAAKKLAFSIQRADVVVRTDPLLAETILRNLIGNAIKYCNEGKVDVSVTPDRGRVAISVNDTGPGIAPHEVSSIFQDFYRSERGGGGLGLGLGIVRRLSGLLLTSVTVQSILGEGSAFQLTLPVTGLEKRPETEPAITAGPAPVHVLVVEDNDDVRAAVAGTIRAWGISVAEARSGAEAHAIEDARTTKPFDVAVVDYDLGDTTGVALMERLSASSPLTRGIIITGSADFQRLKQASAHRYMWLRKPVQAESLQSAITGPSPHG